MWADLAHARTREQEAILLRHCCDARYVWILAVEQHAWWRQDRKSAPGHPEQSRQLTAARANNSRLRVRDVRLPLPLAVTSSERLMLIVAMFEHLVSSL